jgi:glycerol-3-phosphate acyltransferase PlsX
MSPDRGAVTVALDGFGADGGPDVIAAGARAAAGDGVRVRVFGPPDELRGLDAVEGVEVVGATESISNSDEPVRAVRSRPGASVVLAAGDVAEDRSQALVSAGSTGAAMTAALFALKRLHGVHRPALAVQVPVPGREHPVLLLDAGANAEARPGHLVQFAYLGAAFASAVLGVARPRVGLLSVGEEQGKGSPLVVEAGATLADAAGIEFAGNVEGRDIPIGSVDVIVTDGFTGNVALKTMEGTASTVAAAVRAAARSGPRAGLGGMLLRPALGGLRRSLDPDSTGGAILLGLRGVAAVAHGSSGPDGIANAIRLAERAVRERAVERTAELLERSGATRASLRDSGERDRTTA